MSIFDDEPSHTCPEGVVCCEHAHASQDDNQRDLEALLEQAKVVCLAGDPDSTALTLLEDIYCVTNKGNLHPATITASLYPSAWSLTGWLFENKGEDELEAHRESIKELSRLTDIGFARAAGVQNLVFWYQPITEEEKAAAIVPVEPAGQRYEGLGLPWEPAARYTVRTHLMLSTKDGSNLPASLWSAMFTDEDRFTFTRTVPLALDPFLDAEAAGDELWGCRWDAFTVWADRSSGSSLTLTLETASFPYKWILALSAAFPDLTIDGHYRVDVEEGHPAFWEEEFMLTGGYNIWAPEEVLI